MSEQSLVSFFKEGGPVMYLLILLFTLSIPLVVASLALRSRVVSILVIVFAGVILGVGLLGMTLGRSATDRALGFVPENQAEALREKGYREAGRNLQFGGPLALLVGVGGGLSLMRSRPKSAPRPTTAG